MPDGRVETIGNRKGAGLLLSLFQVSSEGTGQGTSGKGRARRRAKKRVSARAKEVGGRL